MRTCRECEELRYQRDAAIEARDAAFKESAEARTALYVARIDYQHDLDQLRLALANAGMNVVPC